MIRTPLPFGAAARLLAGLQRQRADKSRDEMKQLATEGIAPAPTPPNTGFGTERCRGGCGRKISLNKEYCRACAPAESA